MFTTPKRVLVIFLLIASTFAISCKKDNAKESMDARQIVEATGLMSPSISGTLIEDFIGFFNLNREDALEFGYKVEVIDAKQMDLLDGSGTLVNAKVEIQMIEDIEQEDGAILRQILPARRTLIYIFDPSQERIQVLSDSGYSSVEE